MDWGGVSPLVLSTLHVSCCSYDVHVFVGTLATNFGYGTGVGGVIL